MTVQILIGDVRDKLKTLADESVHCVVTSPPYWGLRDYGHEGQIGLEDSPKAFVEAMVGVFADVRRVLRKDGTLWLNLGDSYCPENRGENAKPRAFEGYAPQLQGDHFHADVPTRKSMILAVREDGIKRKDLVGIPWRVAFALQADGWWLRQDIIWAKPNPMPESVTDRCTKSHEYIFLLAKSERYYYAAEAVKEPATDTGRENGREGRDEEPGARPPGSNARTLARLDYSLMGRNKRSVWTVPTKGYPEAHFATFPPALIEPCILAGCPVGGTVLDPFGGAGTTGLVCDRLNRNAILIELNPDYAAMAERRIRGDSPLFAEVGAA